MRESGRFQVRYPGPDGRMRTGPETYARKGDAERALVLVEAQMRAGEWTDPERAKVRLEDYASAWISERPGLRPRTADLYQWLLGKHITPYLGGVPLSKLSTRLIREWRATLLRSGVSVSVAAKAYRLLRAILTTAVEEDNLLPRNPCRIRGAGDERAPERPVLTVAQVFQLAEVIGRHPVGNVRKLPKVGYRLRYGCSGEMQTSAETYMSRADAQRALWDMTVDGHAACTSGRGCRAGPGCRRWCRAWWRRRELRTLADNGDFDDYFAFQLNNSTAETTRPRQPLPATPARRRITSPARNVLPSMEPHPANVNAAQ